MEEFDMDTVTLTHEQFLSFTGWSNNHALNNTKAQRIAKLENMGMQTVSSAGRGKMATYTFTIPEDFWRLLLVPSMAYTEVGADFISHLVEAEAVVDAPEGHVVKFSIETYSELAEKHNAEYKSVEATCYRIHNLLKENGYMRNGTEVSKTHRTKRNGAWTVGKQALMDDQEIRNIWKKFFRRKLAAYRVLHPKAEEVPAYLYSSESRRMYQSDIARWIGADYYRVAKRKAATENMLADIRYARTAFLETFNLANVLTELASRQERYRAEKRHREELDKQRREETEAARPSIEERKALRKELNELEGNPEVLRKAMSPAEQDEHDRMMEDVIKALSEDTDESDEE